MGWRSGRLFSAPHFVAWRGASVAPAGISTAAATRGVTRVPVMASYGKSA